MRIRVWIQLHNNLCLFRKNGATQTLTKEPKYYYTTFRKEQRQIRGRWDQYKWAAGEKEKDDEAVQWQIYLITTTRL